MIGGSITFGGRTKARRTPTYTPAWQRRRVRPARSRAPLDEQVNTEPMLFDRPASLPTATIHSASFASQLRGQRARAVRWVRPRLVPLSVAIVGMLAVLGAAEYLTHLARYTPPSITSTAPQHEAIGQARLVVLSAQ